MAWLCNEISAAHSGTEINPKKSENTPVECKIEKKKKKRKPKGIPRYSVTAISRRIPPSKEK